LLSVRAAQGLVGNRLCCCRPSSNRAKGATGRRSSFQLRVLVNVEVDQFAGIGEALLVAAGMGDRDVAARSTRDVLADAAAE
jgi:hypothetical protein